LSAGIGGSPVTGTQNVFLCRDEVARTAALYDAARAELLRKVDVAAERDQARYALTKAVE
jgi:hypothetical protein